MATSNCGIITVAVLGMTMGLLTAPLQPTAAGETDEAVTAERTYQRWSHARQLRPRRPTDPLREKNISDNEVRQIEQATRAVFPNALVNISGVTTGCPCEDGPDCTDQVWVVAWRSEESHGLRLSLIGGEWVIGPVQRWWLQYESLGDRYDALGALDTEEKWSAARGLMRERMSLIESFPECEPGPARAGEQDDRG